MGYPDQALERANEALTLAQHLEHPYTLRGAHYMTSCISCAGVAVVSERAETAITVAPHTRLRSCWRWTDHARWALAMQGQGAEGLTQSARVWTPIGPPAQAFQRPHFLSMLAEVHGGW